MTPTEHPAARGDEANGYPALPIMIGLFGAGSIMMALLALTLAHLDTSSDGGGLDYILRLGPVSIGLIVIMLCIAIVGRWTRSGGGGLAIVLLLAWFGVIATFIALEEFSRSDTVLIEYNEATPADSSSAPN